MASRNDNELARIISEAVTTALRQARTTSPANERNVASTSTSTANNEFQVCIVLYYVNKRTEINNLCRYIECISI